jgi:hypothetical protein
MAFRRRWVIVAAILVMALGSAGCVKSGEIAVRNSTDETILVLPHSEKDECSMPPTSNRSRWTAITPGGEEDLVVASGTWIGKACLSVLGRTSVSVEVGPGRLYEVTEGEQNSFVNDIGAHDEAWYFDLQRWDRSWSSWWLWFYAVPVLLGAPVGLFITVRFFYRFYVLKRG